jgi:hypothetical protein
MELLSPDDPRAPRFWRYEKSGVLAPVVEAYLLGQPLSLEQIGVMRAYLRQWIQSPVWGANPAGAGELEQLRAAVALIRTREDIRRWLALALAEGMDPL